MTVIRVNPASIQQYGGIAQEKFTAIRTELERLVTECAEVHYFGPNAVQFKTHCGQLAAEFASQAVQKMGAIADVVRTATSNITASLGGTAIVISIDGSSVPVPSVAAVDYVDVDTSALEGLLPKVAASFTNIDQFFDEHLQALVSTDWLGNAKDETVSAVRGFTGSAKSVSADSRQKITTLLQTQIEAVVQADRT